MKKTTTALICVLAAAALALGGLSIAQKLELDKARRVNEIYGEHALGELEAGLYAMDAALQKSLYASDAALLSQLCAEAAANGEAALTALHSLPYATHELEKLIGALNGAGDYALAVSRSASRGEAANGETLSRLAAAGETVSALADDVREIRAALDDNALELDDYGEGADAGRADTVGYELRAVDEALPSPSALAYDGQYAARDESPEATVDEAAAKRTAALFRGVPEQRLLSQGQSGGARPVWWFTLSAMEGEDERLGVDAVTGRVAEWSACRSPSGGETTEEQAKAAAAEFLERHELSGLEPVYVETDEGMTVITYAGKLGEALRLTETVSVAVDRETGEVCAYTAQSPRTRAPEQTSPAVSPEEAAGKLAESLTPRAARLVAAGSAGGGAEKLCWELACAGPEGESVTVYVDALTGGQEKIEISAT